MSSKWCTYIKKACKQPFLDPNSPEAPATPAPRRSTRWQPSPWAADSVPQPASRKQSQWHCKRPEEWDRSFPSFRGKTKWDEPAFTLLQSWDLVLPYWDFRHQVNLCDFFLSLYWTCYNIAFVYVLVFFGREACGTLSPGAGIEPAAPELEGKVLTTGPTENSLNLVWSWKAETGSLKDTRCL